VKRTQKLKKRGMIMSAPLDLILAANGMPTGDQLREQRQREERDLRRDELRMLIGFSGSCDCRDVARISEAQPK